MLSLRDYFSTFSFPHNNFLCLCFQTLGGGVPCARGQWCSQVAASLRGPGAREHHLHPGHARLRLPHHSLQLAGREDSRRAAGTAG